VSDIGGHLERVEQFGGRDDGGPNFPNGDPGGFIRESARLRRAVAPAARARAMVAITVSPAPVNIGDLAGRRGQVAFRRRTSATSRWRASLRGRVRVLREIRQRLIHGAQAVRSIAAAIVVSTTLKGVSRSA